MKRSPLAFLSVLILSTGLLTAWPAQAQLTSLPALGAPAPSYIFTAEKHSKECETGPGHKDPCAQIEFDKARFTVAWDAQTKVITYLFTNDPRVVTDTQLSVGGSCRVVQPSGAPDPTVAYLKWVIDPKWKGMDHEMTGDAVWYAALQKNFDPAYGNIVGLVQSRYIVLTP